MLIKKYRVLIINPALYIASEKTQFDITANSMSSAWKKFCRMYFGAINPNPADYDISLIR